MAFAKEIGSIKFSCPLLIVCEGLDAALFLANLLNHLFGKNHGLFQVEKFDGNEDLPLMLKTLPNLPKFNGIKTLTVIRDAETNASGANQSVQELLRRTGFAVPDKQCVLCFPKEEKYRTIISYALFPTFSDDSTNGTLEDLCFNILPKSTRTDMKNIVEIALNQAEKLEKHTHPHKNRLYTYLSLTDKFVGLKLGEAAFAKAFDFDDALLAPLKELLQSVLDLGEVA